MEGLSQVPSRRALRAGTAQGDRFRAFLFLQRTATRITTLGRSEAARHRGHEWGVGAGGGPTLHTALFSARGEGQSECHDRQPGEGFSHQDIRSWVDVPSDKRKGISKAGRTGDWSWISRQMGRLLDAEYRARGRAGKHAPSGGLPAHAGPQQVEAGS